MAVIELVKSSNPLRGRTVPRTPRNGRASTRGRRSRSLIGGTQPIVEQISQIVSANEALQRENKDLAAQNEQLRTQLREIGNALDRLTGGGRRRRGRGARALPEVRTAKPPRQRRPITDPQVLEKRRQALARAREVRAARLAASKAAAGDGSRQS